MALQHPTTGEQATDRNAGSTRCDDCTDGVEPLEATTVLELLGDEFTREVLRALGDGPRTGRQIMDTTDVSRPTMYRRLNQLQEAGLVEAATKIRPNGHHCKEFRLVVDRLDLGLDADGFSVDARSGADRSPDEGTLRIERAPTSD